MTDHIEYMGMSYAEMVALVVENEGRQHVFGGCGVWPRYPGPSINRWTTACRIDELDVCDLKEIIDHMQEEKYREIEEEMSRCSN